MVSILTFEPVSNLVFFLSLDADRFFFFFLDECSLDLILSGFTDGRLVVLGASGLVETFS